MSTLEFYDKNNIEKLIWPKNYDGQYAKNYFLPLIQECTSNYISNIDAHIYIIKLDDKIIPLVQSKSQSNCYVCNPYAQYITYAKFELRELKSPLLEKFLEKLVDGLGFLLRLANFNNVVIVNNWFLSTNLYPKLSKKEITQINQLLCQKFPKTLILYRSLNKYTNQQLMQDLESLGGKKILSRSIYLTDPKKPSYENRSDYKKDQKHLSKTKLHINHQVTENDILGIKDCYDDLYLGKYSELNPQFTTKFFYNSLKHHLFKFKVITKDAKVVAALGYFQRENVMTTPIFGFDQKMPIKLGLYRLISSLLMNESRERGLILNQSSGASQFKFQRGATPYIEYNIFFRNNVSVAQFFCWLALSKLLNSFGVYMLKKFKL